MDRQRREIKSDTGIAEAFDIRGVRNARAPHPRTGGKDLKCVRAKLVGGQRRIFQRFRTRRVDSDSQNAIVAGYKPSLALELETPLTVLAFRRDCVLA
jgi:hypothetical protein